MHSQSDAPLSPDLGIALGIAPKSKLRRRRLEAPAQTGASYAQKIPVSSSNVSLPSDQSSAARRTFPLKYRPVIVGSSRAGDGQWSEMFLTPAPLKLGTESLCPMSYDRPVWSSVMWNAHDGVCVPSTF